MNQKRGEIESVKNWSKEAVIDWVESIGMKKYSAQFATINGGEALLSINNKNLKHNGFTIRSTKDRNHILTEIENLKGASSTKTIDSKILTLSYFLSPILPLVSELLKGKERELCKEHKMQEQAQRFKGNQRKVWQSADVCRNLDIYYGRSYYRRWKCLKCWPGFRGPTDHIKHCTFAELGPLPMCPLAISAYSKFKSGSIPFLQANMDNFQYNLTKYKK